MTMCLDLSTCQQMKQQLIVGLIDVYLYHEKSSGFTIIHHQRRTEQSSSFG